MNTGIKFSVGRPLPGTGATSAAEPIAGCTMGRGVPLLLPIDPADGGPGPALDAGEGTSVLPGQAGLKEQIVLPRIRPAMVRA